MARGTTLVGVGLLLAAAAMPAQAQSVADFYKGKTVNVLIGVAPGGEYDLQARLVARHIGKHIPGRPNVVPQNMTGAGGLNMANYLASIAARDGTYIGMLSNTLPSLQAVGGRGVKFDSNKFLWLGTIAPVVETMAVWHTAEVKSVADASEREIVAGSTGRGSTTHVYPAMMNEFLGTKFKLVTGYRGGADINLAIERREIDGRSNYWTGWTTVKPDWIREGKLKFLFRTGPKAPEMVD
jgi:tripartite-type tricarboxylate transporter receptor subunit TctC